MSDSKLSPLVNTSGKINKLIPIMGFILVSLILISVPILAETSIPLGNSYEIDGDTVFINTSDAYVSARPHTIPYSRYVYFNVTSKTYDGNITAIWGFNTSNTNPRNADLYNPHNHSYNSSSQKTLLSVNSVETTANSCDYGNDYNPEHYSVNHTDNTTQQTVEETVCFDNYTQSGNDYTVYWHTNEWEMRDWTPLEDIQSIQYNYNGKDTWYYLENVPINVNQSYQVRSYINTEYDTEGKYDFAVYPSSYGFDIEAADNDGNLYMLDPWWTTGSINDSLVAHWKMDETSGTLALDSVDNHAYNGTASDSLVMSNYEGIRGTVADFMNNQFYINIDNFSKLYTDAGSISIWANASGTSEVTSKKFVGDGKSGVGSSDTIVVSTYAGDYRFDISTIKDGAELSLRSNTSLNYSDEWNHITVTWDGAEITTEDEVFDHMKIYVNGEELTGNDIKIHNIAGLPTNVTPRSPLYQTMFGRGDSSVYISESYMDEVLWFNKSLSSDEIYNDLYGSYVNINTAPSISITAPPNETHTYNVSPSIQYIVDDPDNTTVSCSLFFNNSKYSTNSSVENNTASNFTLLNYPSSGTFWYWLNCSDGIDTNTSLNYSLTIDGRPRAQLINYTNATINYTLENHTFFYNVTSNASTNMSATLFIDGVNKSFNSTALNNTRSNFSNISFSSIGTKWIWIEASNGTFNTTSDNYTIIIGDRPTINSVVTIPDSPRMTNDVKIRANVTPANSTNNVEWVNLTVWYPDNTKAIDNENMTSWGDSWWNSTTAVENIVANGTFNYSIHAKDNGSSGNIHWYNSSFAVPYTNYSISKVKLDIVILRLENNTTTESLLNSTSNISIETDDSALMNFTFVNSSTMTFENSTGTYSYSLTDYFETGWNITTLQASNTSNVTEYWIYRNGTSGYPELGTYNWTMTITRELDGAQKVMDVFMSISDKIGNLVILNSDTYIKTMTDDESYTNPIHINNTGDFNVSGITCEAINTDISPDLSPFTTFSYEKTEIEPGEDITIDVTVNTPAEGHYYGHFLCEGKGADLDSDEALTYDTKDYNINVDEAPSSGTGGSGGTVIEIINVTTNETLFAGVCNYDGVCDSDSGENVFTCPEDCGFGSYDLLENPLVTLLLFFVSLFVFVAIMTAGADTKKKKKKGNKWLDKLFPKKKKKKKLEWLS